MGWTPEGQDWVRTNVNRPAILKTAVDTLDKTGVESRNAVLDDSGQPFSPARLSAPAANIDIAVTPDLKTGLITNGRVVVTMYVAVERVPAEAYFSVSYFVFWFEFLLMLDLPSSINRNPVSREISHRTVRGCLIRRRLIFI
jgi:hypothetical protein